MTDKRFEYAKMIYDQIVNKENTDNFGRTTGACKGVYCDDDCPMWNHHDYTIGQAKSYLKSIIGDTMDKLVEGEKVYVSNFSQEEANQCSNPGNQRIYVASTQDGRHLCVMRDSEGAYKNGIPFNAHAYRFVSKVSDFKEVTMADVEKLFGCKVKIVK